MMKRFVWLAIYCVLSCSRVGLADQIVTDANIVTGLDISDSVDAATLRLEIDGMAKAVRAPEVLTAIQSGRHGRIGFAVFAWHHRQFPQLVGWTVIHSAKDAEAVSRMIEERLHVNVDAEAREAEAFYTGRLTNLSQAIDYATVMLEEAPYRTDHSIINIIGNGKDNVSEDAQFARDRAIAFGSTVNAVALDGDPGLLDYYRRQVIGGPGAFAISTRNSVSMINVMTRKFWYEIAMALGDSRRLSADF